MVFVHLIIVEPGIGRIHRTATRAETGPPNAGFASRAHKPTITGIKGNSRICYDARYRNQG